MSADSEDTGLPNLLNQGRSMGPGDALRCDARAGEGNARPSIFRKSRAAPPRIRAGRPRSTVKYLMEKPDACTKDSALRVLLDRHFGHKHEYQELSRKNPDESEEEEMCQCDWEIRIERFNTSIMISNALALSMETLFPQLLATWWYDVIEQGLWGFFAVTCLLRWYLASCPCQPQHCWDWFDLTICTVGAMDFSIFVIHQHKFVVPWHEEMIEDFVEFLRVLRVVRLFRLLKELAKYESKFIQETYSHWTGFRIGVHALGSASLVLVFFLLVSSVFLVLTVGRVSRDDPHYDFLHERLGNLWSAFVTLFQLVVEPDLIDFDPMLYPYACRPIFTCFIFVFVVLGNFGLLTVLNGVVSEQIAERNEKRKKMQRQDYRKVVRAVREEVTEKVFGREAAISLCDFSAHFASGRSSCNVEKMIKIFRQHNVALPQEDIYRMLDLLSVCPPENESSGDHMIEKDDFEYFVTQLVRGKSPMLAMEHFFETMLVKRYVRQVARKQDTMCENMNKLTQAVDQVTQAVDRIEAQLTPFFGARLSRFSDCSD